MAVQTTVSFDHAVAIAGGVRGVVPQTRTRVAEVAIQAGLAACQGTADAQCKLPTTSGEVAKVLGIAPSRVTSDPNFPPGGTAGFAYQIGDAVDLVPEGQVWVVVEESVVAMDPVFVRFATGAGGSQKGSFRKSADTATAAQLTGARYLTSASANGLALVEINVP